MSYLLHSTSALSWYIKVIFAIFLPLVPIIIISHLAPGADPA